MPRAKGGVVARKSHKKVMKQAKGYFSRRKNIFRVAVQAVEKAEQYAYRDRRTKKRNFRSLWIQRINAATRELGLTCLDLAGSGDLEPLLGRGLGLHLGHFASSFQSVRKPPWHALYRPGGLNGAV